LRYDVSAARALDKFSAIVDSLLTPKNSKWHMLTPEDDGLKKHRPTMEYLEAVTNALFKYRYKPTSGFVNQNIQNWMNLGAFGSGCMFIDPLDWNGEKGLRYRQVPMGEVYYKENHQGQIDTMLRHFWLTGRQAMQKYRAALPYDFIGKVSTNAATMEAMYRFLHCVRPQKDYDRKLFGPKGFPFESVHVLYQESSRTVLQEGGYRSFPYAVSRYKQAPGEVYGRGPAMDVLDAIKTLNAMKKTLLKQGHRAVDPVILAADDGVIDEINLKPGAINRGGMNAEGKPLVGVLPIGNVNIGKELLDDERTVINDVFLLNLFQILTETPEMTATEVIERTREKGILLAPTVGRQENEYLGPLISREIDVLIQQGLLPPMPPELAAQGGVSYGIRYDSPLSRAMRAEEVSGLLRTVESVLTIVNVTQNPEPLDWFEWDEIVPDVAGIQGVPRKRTAKMEKVMAVRQQSAQAQEGQQQASEAPGQAALMKASSVAQDTAIRTGQVTPAQAKALAQQ